MFSVDVKHHVCILTEGHSQLRSCVKVEVDVLGSPSLIVRTVSVDVKHHVYILTEGPSEFRIYIYFTEFRSCVKVEVAVLGFPS